MMHYLACQQQRGPRRSRSSTERPGGGKLDFPLSLSLSPREVSKRAGDEVGVEAETEVRVQQARIQDSINTIALECFVMPNIH